MPSTSSAWWSCVCSSTSDTASGNAAAPQLRLREVPSSALSPLFFSCSSCAARLAPCESCHVLLDASHTQADGALLCCRRCGALSVFDASLRALLAIAPFSRALLKRVPFVIEPLAALRERIHECGELLQRARTSEEREETGSDLEITQPPEPQRKRKRAEDTQVSVEAATPSCATDSLSSSSRTPEEMVAALEAEEAALQRQLRDEVRRWEQFAAETTDPSALLLQHQQQQQQTFSATHLNILKVMYATSMDKLELAALVHQIEQFLLHQSTLLKMKFDVLTAVDSCREAEQLYAPALHARGHDRSIREPRVWSAAVSMTQVTNMVVNSTKEQLRHRYDSFQALSRPHLALVGVANAHLIALYSAAQSLQRSGAKQANHGKNREPLAIQRELFSMTSGGRSSTSDEHEAVAAAVSRARRRYSSGPVNTTVFGEHHRLLGGGYETLSHVQQSLELGNHIAEISKKVELWRALSATISTTCVLSVLELASVTDSPLS